MHYMIYYHMYVLVNTEILVGLIILPKTIEKFPKWNFNSNRLHFRDVTHNIDFDDQLKITKSSMHHWFLDEKFGEEFFYNLFFTSFSIKSYWCKRNLSKRRSAIEPLVSPTLLVLVCKIYGRSASRRRCFNLMMNSPQSVYTKPGCATRRKCFTSVVW